MSSTPRPVALASITPQPWRNGGGSTRELYAWPARGDWRARISVADVARDGPFSAYPGVTRWFAVIDGAGVDLEFASGNMRVLHGAPPLRFAGEEAPACRLVGGPTRDLNLMLRGVDGAIVAAVDHRPWSPAGVACGLYASVGGVCHVSDGRHRVEAHTLLWFDARPPVLRFAADADDGSPIGWWLQHGGTQ